MFFWQLYRRLSEVLGLNDETMVLSVFIGKISVRKLVKLSAVQFMLNNHTSEHFSFLGINSQSSLSDMRCRTTFYTALGRLLMVDLGIPTFPENSGFPRRASGRRKIGNRAGSGERPGKTGLGFPHPNKTRGRFSQSQNSGSIFPF
ncbi:hypothetical protein DV515_00017845 [Chloebia gouldiae]|uniref:Exportin-7/Ran-binding protein 17 TPR repeats domain-containing protein n=1 Tax=Chloebia gouldiae TaxID=44316 RepID=A0A3L8Q8N5_CHLGU|nr:hypothetical protein DV515_00018024 [Chloebia gouldiae]RLV63855.1 hypothetical protein DV515_00017845 [Chloebia gouldiae]